ncbi:MAG: SLC13 family permease [Alphaproteobacteria bacterium]|nr:SLC13 family permease [Alphaproteobacteria bacterium]
MAPTLTERSGLNIKVIGASIFLAALALLLPLPDGLSEDARRVAVVGVVMAAWWVSEAVPLQVTALLPIVAFPVAGVADLETTARPYAHPLIFLFLGGFLLAAAMQRWRLHWRLALAVLAVSGPCPRYQVLAMMVGTAFLSLWISNTATAMVMVPIGLSLVASTRDQAIRVAPAGSQAELAMDPEYAHETGPGSRAQPAASEDADAFGAAIMLGIAFAATIGGMGSLIGTPPNALLAGFAAQNYGISIGFAQWMALGVPIVVVLLPVTWLLLTRFIFRLPDASPEAPREVSDRAPLSSGQRRVAIVLVATAAAWVLRPLIMETFGLSGLSDAGIAVTAALLLFLLPDGLPGGRPLLTWEEAKSIRWDVLILFGGGLALADAIAATGLAAWISSGAGALAGLPVFLLVLAMIIMIVYLGELASNTAMAAVFLPIAGAVAIGLGMAPLTLLVPVALAASLGFMLPVSTPPNAIVYGTGAVSARQMLRAGAWLDVISIVIVFGFAWFVAPLVLDMQATVLR